DRDHAAELPARQAQSAVTGLAPPYGTRDPAGMAGWIETAAEQVEEALAILDRADWPPRAPDPDLLALGGRGGSAIAADLPRGLFGDRLQRPFLAVREYRWPAWVTERSRALLSSYSGDTEETLALYREAGEKRIPRLAITTGGTLARWCERDRVPCLVLPGGR